MLLERSKRRDHSSFNEIVRKDEGIYCGLVDDITRHSIFKSWNDYQLTRHFHVMAIHSIFGLKPGEHCAYFHAPAISLDRGYSIRSGNSERGSLNVRRSDGKHTMFVPIVDGLKYRQLDGVRLFPPMIWLKRINERCCPLRKMLQPSFRSPEVLFGAANWKCNAPLFIASKFLLNAGKCDMVQSGSETVRSIPKSQRKIDRQFLKGGQFYDKPPLAASLNRSGIKLRVNESLLNCLRLLYVNFGPPKLLQGR